MMHLKSVGVWLCVLCLGCVIASCDADDAQTLSDTATSAADTADISETPPDTHTEPDTHTDPGDADTAQADGLEPLPERPWAVTEQGFFGVGYRTAQMTYTPRSEAGGTRTLRLALWYPTRDTAGMRPRYFGLFSAPDGVFKDATLAAEAVEAGKLPLFVFSHGHQGYAESSGFLAEFLASHGWVVAAPDHAGNTTLDDPNRTTPIYYLRPQDVSAVVDFLKTLPETDPLAGKVMERAVVGGHSFGGYTGLGLMGGRYDMDLLRPACDGGVGPGEFCSQMSDEAEGFFREGFDDPRLVAGVLMAPGDFNLFGAGISEIGRPVLLMTGGHDTSTTNAGSGDPIWGALLGAERVGHVRLDFVRGGHLTFTDTCALGAQESGCRAEDVPASDAQGAIKAWALAFARYHLLSDAAAGEFLSEPPLLLDASELVISRHD